MNSLTVEGGQICLWISGTQHRDLLFGLGEGIVTASRQHNATLKGLEGIFKTEITLFQDFHEGFEFLQRLLEGGSLRRVIGFGLFTGHVSGVMVAQGRSTLPQPHCGGNGPLV